MALCWQMALACWPNGDANRSLLGQANAYGPLLLHQDLVWVHAKSMQFVNLLSFIHFSYKHGGSYLAPSLLAGEVYERCAFAFTVMSCALATPWLLAPTENAGYFMLVSKNTKVFESSAMEEVTAGELYMLEQLDTLDNSLQMLQPKAPNNRSVERQSYISSILTSMLPWYAYMYVSPCIANIF